MENVPTGNVLILQVIHNIYKNYLHLFCVIFSCKEPKLDFKGRRLTTKSLDDINESAVRGKL